MPAGTPRRVPVIDFDPVGRAAHEHLLAFLVSPLDPRRRRQFLAMRAAVLKANASGYVENYLATAPTLRLRRMNQNLALAQYQQVLEREMIIPSGGLDSVIDSLPPALWEKEVLKMRRGPMVGAGRLLLFIAQMDRHHPNLTASTRRAHEVLKAWGRVGGEIPAQRELTQMWKRYGGVAPLYAAMIASMEDWPTDEAGLGVAARAAGSVRRVLAWAAWFRDFTLCHKPKGAQGSLLKPDKVLVLPSEIAPEEPPLCPLPPKLLAAAESYRAPVPEQ